MKKTLVLAAAGLFAVALTARAESWFDANISQYDAWPNPTVGPTGGAWTADAENVAKLESNKLVLTNFFGDLEFEATKAVDATRDMAVIQSTISYTAFDLDDLPEIPSGTKGALIVVDEGESVYAYYGLTKVGEVNAWTKLAALGTPVVDEDVTVSISIFNGKIKYAAGESATDWLDVVLADNNVQYAAYQGRGEVAALSSTSEEMYASVTFPDMTDKNIASVTVNGVSIPLAGGSYDYLKGTVLTNVYTATDGRCFTNECATLTFVGTLTQNFTIDAEDLPTTTEVGELTGLGTEESPYIIATEANLVTLRKGVNTGKYGVSGQFFKQTADIALTTDWLSIGNSTHRFSGNYDGDNHAITDIRLLRVDDNGLFGYLSGATMKNINLTYLGLSTTDPAPTGTFMIGGLAACAYDSTNINVTVNGSIGDETNPVTHNLGGICAFVAGDSLLVGCTNNASLYGVYTKTCGLVAYCSDKVACNTIFDRCANNGTVTAANQTSAGNATLVGGIIGYARYPVTLRDCSSLGAIYASNQVNPEKVNCGSFIGSASTVTLEGTQIFRASLVPFGNTTIAALTYATVDGEGIATAVAGMTPEVGGTYTLYAPVTSGTVATFTTRADTLTIDTNGYNFAGTIAIDPAVENAKIVSSAADTVVTFTVGYKYEAIVNGSFCATLAEALTNEGATVIAFVPVTISGDDPTEVNASTLILSNSAAVAFSNGAQVNNALAVSGTGSLTLAGESTFVEDVNVSALPAARFTIADESSISIGENTVTLPRDLTNIGTFLTDKVSAIEGGKAKIGRFTWTYMNSSWQDTTQGALLFLGGL